MSSEPTSSVTAVTTSSLVTTAAPVTTTVNNVIPPPDINIEKIDNKFSYDDTSKNLSIILIVLGITIVLLDLSATRAFINEVVDYKYKFHFKISWSLIVIIYIIISALLIKYYHDLEKTVFVPQDCRDLSPTNLKMKPELVNCPKYINNDTNNDENNKIYRGKKIGVILGLGFACCYLFLRWTYQGEYMTANDVLRAKGKW
jgi:hypothetical protein